MRVALALLLAASAASAQTAGTRKVYYAAQLNDRANFRIWNLAGSMRVTGWDKDSLVVRGTVPVGVDFFCGGRGDMAKCGTDIPPSDDPEAAASTFEIMVPRHAQLWLKSASADLTISAFDGDLDAYSVSGAIRLTGSPKDVTVESMAGAIVVDIAARTLRAKTAGGSIRLNGTIEDVDASSVSGDVVIDHAGIERGRFEAVDGDIAWAGALTQHANLEFGSHSGTIELRLPAKTGGEFTVTTFSGSVSSDFGGAGAIEAHDLGNHPLRFVLRGDDRMRVAVRNFKGNTVFRRL